MNLMSGKGEALATLPRRTKLVPGSPQRRASGGHQYFRIAASQTA